MISKRVQELKPSPTMALSTLAGKLKAEGHDVISLSVGEPDWDTYDIAKEAGIAAIQNGKTKYLPAAGTPELRQAIAEQIKKDIGINYETSCVTVSTGAKFIVFGALQALVDPGDEVVIPAPYWVSYPDMAQLAGGVPRIALCDEKNNFKLTPDLLRQSLNEKTKVFILNSPSNPTGEVYSKEELQALGQVLSDFPKVVVLSDDIYNRLVFSGGVAPHLLEVCPQLQDRTVVINGVSKSYSMTGWRVGWAAGPQELISAMNRYQSQSVSCASSISQAAALEAVKNGDRDVERSLEKLRGRMELVYEGLKALPGTSLRKPQGAFYAWLNVSSHFGKSYKEHKIQGSEDFSKFLLEDQKVAATAGIHFGLEGFLRISYALNEERMQQAIDRLGSFISHLS